MAKRDDTSKRRLGRTRIKQVTFVTPKPSGSTDSSNPSPRSSSDRLKESIEAERAQLMQAHAVVKCLSAALMNTDDDDAMYYVDAANVAADLIDEAVGRLNGIGMGKGVREPFTEYVVCRPLCAPPNDSQLLGDSKLLPAPHQ